MRPKWDSLKWSQWHQKALVQLITGNQASYNKKRNFHALQHVIKFCLSVSVWVVQKVSFCLVRWCHLVGPGWTWPTKKFYCRSIVHSTSRENALQWCNYGGVNFLVILEIWNIKQIRRCQRLWLHKASQMFAPSSGNSAFLQPLRTPVYHSGQQQLMILLELWFNLI